jgi:hypothetical protein
MRKRRDIKGTKVRLDREYERWITEGTGTAAQFLGMTDKEFEDWLLYKLVPERFLK